VYHAAHKEDKEVQPGHERVRAQERVDEAQKEEGIDGLHVVPVSPSSEASLGL
jgi:hypothetical protein